MKQKRLSMKMRIEKDAKLYADKYSDGYIENIKVRQAYIDGARAVEKDIKDRYILEPR
jgi:hypothetical protein